MAPLAGEPLLLRLMERVRQAQFIDDAVVATSTEASDDVVEELCLGRGISVFRGPLDDVLKRFLGVCEALRPQAVVRLTGDNPLVDADIVDAVVARHRSTGADYTSNSIDRTFPYGLDVEVVDSGALFALNEMALTPQEREHVTLGIRNRPELFLIESVRRGEDLSSLRFTVDYPEDLFFAQSVFDHLYPSNARFRLADVLSLLAREPGLTRTVKDAE